MKKRMISLVLSLWLLCTLAMPALAVPNGSVVLSGTQAEGELAVTVSVQDLKLNVMELYLAYDAERLEPKGEGAGLLEALQPAYDPWEDEGWMQASAALDEENGVIRCLIMADPEARGGDTLDSEGYLNVGSTAMSLFTVRFRIREGARVYADSVHLGKSAGAETGIVIADGTAKGITSAETVRISLGTTEKTPGGVSEGYFGGRPEEPQPPVPTEQPGNSDPGTGNQGGGTDSGTTDPGTAEVPGKAAFTDITGHWARASIEELVSAGVIRGYGDGTFRPNASLTRAELCSVLAGYFELTGKRSGSEVFTDCSGHWASSAIGAAYEAGLVSGIGGGQFAPDRAVTRQELVTIIARAAKLDGGTPEFTDRGEIAPWAASHIAAAVQAGLVSGYPDGSFRPNNSVTRAEMTTVLVHLNGQAVEI